MNGRCLSVMLMALLGANCSDSDAELVDGGRAVSDAAANRVDGSVVIDAATPDAATPDAATPDAATPDASPVLADAAPDASPVLADAAAFDASPVLADAAVFDAAPDVDAAPPPDAAVALPFNAAHAVFAAKCGPCHTTSSFGGHSIGAAAIADAYEDSQLAPYTANATTKAEAALVRIKNGSMPNGAGCSGDPATDSGNAACLTQVEQDIVEAWILAGQQAPL